MKSNNKYNPNIFLKLLWFIRIKFGFYSKKKSIKIQESQKFTYMMLSRLQSDCEYFLNWGNGCKNRLHCGDIDTHIDYMLCMCKPLIFKPEWITIEQIEQYRKDMKEKGNQG